MEENSRCCGIDLLKVFCCFGVLIFHTFTAENSIENAVKDLEYFRNEMIRLHKANELFDDEIVDLMGFVNTIITHITNGNQNEERLVS